MSETNQPHDHATIEGLKRTVSLADSLWTVVGLLGWKETLVAAIITAGGWASGYLRGEPVVSLTMSAIALFAILVFLSKLPMFANAISARPNVQVWRRVQNLTLGEAACLLAETNPSSMMGSGIFPTATAQGFYRLLAEAVLRGQLERSPSELIRPYNIVQPQDQLNMGTLVTRESLQKFAQKQGIRSRILR